MSVTFFHYYQICWSAEPGDKESFYNKVHVFMLRADTTNIQSRSVDTDRHPQQIYSGDSIISFVKQFV